MNRLSEGFECITKWSRQWNVIVLKKNLSDDEAALSTKSFKAARTKMQVVMFTWAVRNESSKCQDGWRLKRAKELEPTYKVSNGHYVAGYWFLARNKTLKTKLLLACHLLFVCFRLECILCCASSHKNPPQLSDVFFMCALVQAKTVQDAPLAPSLPLWDARIVCYSLLFFFVCPSASVSLQGKLSFPTLP